MSSEADDSRPQPTTLPKGCELPDGRVLTFEPHRDCGCADCEAAFAAYDRGDLRIPDPDGLPW